MALTNDRVSRQKKIILKCSFFLKFILMEFNFREKNQKNYSKWIIINEVMTFFLFNFGHFEEKS